MSTERPKRQIIQKTLDYNNGILWREEKELRKALYASLQSVKQQKTSSSAPGSLCPTPPNYNKVKDMESTTSEQEKCNDTDKDTDKQTDNKEKVKVNKVKGNKVKVAKVRGDKVRGEKVKVDNAKSEKKNDRVKVEKVKVDKKEKTKGKGRRTGKIEKGQSSTHDANSKNNKFVIRKKRKEILSACSVSCTSETDTDEPSKAKRPRTYNAQRKFAQSLPGTPNTTPVKCPSGKGKSLTTKRPKTEDFLTFLCLRGTSVLPVTMEMFGAPSSPDASETKEVELKEVKVANDNSQVAIDNNQYAFNEDSGLSFDRTSSIFPDNVASPASSITELTMDESTSESIHEVAKMRGRVTTPVNTHISSHSPPLPTQSLYKPPGSSTPPPPTALFKLASTPSTSGIVYKQPPSTPPQPGMNKAPSTPPQPGINKAPCTPTHPGINKASCTPPQSVLVNKLPTTPQRRENKLSSTFTGVNKLPSTPPQPGTINKLPSTPPGAVYKPATTSTASIKCKPTATTATASMECKPTATTTSVVVSSKPVPTATMVTAGMTFKPCTMQTPVVSTPPLATVYKNQSMPTVAMYKNQSTPTVAVYKPISTSQGIVFKTSQPPNLQAAVPLPATSTVSKTRPPPPLIPIISRCASKAIPNHSAVTAPSLTVPPPIMSTGMSSTRVRNHTVTSPEEKTTGTLSLPVRNHTITSQGEKTMGTSSMPVRNHTAKSKRSLKDRDGELAKYSKQSHNHVVEKVHINNVAIKNNNEDKLNKTKKSKPPKLLYIPPKRLKQMSEKDKASLINHSSVVRIEACDRDVSVLLNDNLKNNKVNHQSPKNNIVRQKRNANRVVKNNVVNNSVANCTRSVSDGTRNVTAKQQNSIPVSKDVSTHSKNEEDSVSADESPSPPKKKRGRPPGSKNKRTLLKQGQGTVLPTTTATITTTVTTSSTHSTTPATSKVTATTSNTTATKDATNHAITRSNNSTACTNRAACANPVTCTNRAACTSRTAPANPVTCTNPATEADNIPTEAKIYNAPIFHPTTEEWQDPIAYIEQITPKALPFGMCKVIPPQGWRPECKLSDDMRFTTQIQYVHKMQKRWGNNVQQLQCIKKHLAEQGVELTTSPQIGGCELDLVRFSNTMAQHGGLQNVPDKKRWNKVADSLRIPKAAQDRLTKLDAFYCKYLLSYDMLSQEEKDKLEKQVIVERQRKSRAVAEHERNSCFIKGRSVALTQFFRVARNTMSLCFKNEPSVSDVEHEYWRLVEDRSQHVAVQCGRVDTSTAGRHMWNLNNLAQNQGNILHYLGKEPGVTVPWLKVGMLYSTEFWKVDPHSLPTVEYLHTGADKIWYCIPHSQKDKFESAMKSIVPEMCILNSKNCIAKSSVMVPPSTLVEHDVAVSKVVLEEDQYLLTFPGAYTSSVCCGYNVTECVYYALPSWLDYGMSAFKLTKDQRVSTKFAVERLLCLAATIETHRSNKELCKCLLKEVQKIRDDELQLRDQLSSSGIHSFVKMSSSDGYMSTELRRKKVTKIQVDPGDKTCDICGQLCYLSMVVHDKEDDVYCLQHAYNHIKKGGSRACRGLKLMYRYDKDHLNKLVDQLEEVVGEKSKASPGSEKSKASPGSEKSKASPGRGRNSNKRRSADRDSET